MDEKLIDHMLTCLDDHSQQLVDLSKVVHTNAGTLGLISKITVGVVTFIIVTSLGFWFTVKKPADSSIIHNHREPTEQVVQYPIRKGKG